ncbi:nitrile hydratase accessory protein [Arthrobacter sp. AB6]|uniref:nitrile hydratase accessory protein n=1 Tax=Arthrobacter sp. AB6 TaxID=2962570 RepID=UPI002880E2F2|nr:nitrile hydratase accessory protein [Arthrobacter sp. AB6]MDT0196688.1 nitrile hydratase accessory protein [Arthrobacter sp. AB6]
MTELDFTYDDSGRAQFHDTCVTDTNQPQFQEEWQRRAFGLAVALSEFGHYSWDDFQGELIRAIDQWQDSGQTNESWEYYDHWVNALQRIVNTRGLAEDGYIGPRDRDDH